MQEKAEQIAALLAEIDRLGGEDRAAFREHFVAAVEAEGALDVGSALACLMLTVNEAFA